MLKNYLTKEKFEKVVTQHQAEMEARRRGWHLDMFTSYDWEQMKKRAERAVDRFDGIELTYLRQAIIWKSLGFEAKDFYSNGETYIYEAIWDKLPTVDGLKAGKKYSATWGYDQTNVTTARHYGRYKGLDVLITGGFGYGKVLLKRIKNDRFNDGCIYFRLNTYTDEEINEINTYASYYGR